ncbi:hypothetical protein M8C21_024846, partial [Ambrosia artemisiifolia]
MLRPGLGVATPVPARASFLEVICGHGSCIGAALMRYLLISATYIIGEIMGNMCSSTFGGYEDDPVEGSGRYAR